MCDFEPDGGVPIPAWHRSQMLTRWEFTAQSTGLQVRNHDSQTRGSGSAFIARTSTDEAGTLERAEARDCINLGRHQGCSGKLTWGQSRGGMASASHALEQLRFSRIPKTERGVDNGAALSWRAGGTGNAGAGARSSSPVDRRRRACKFVGRNSRVFADESCSADDTCSTAQIRVGGAISWPPTSPSSFQIAGLMKA